MIDEEEEAEKDGTTRPHLSDVDISSPLPDPILPPPLLHHPLHHHHRHHLGNESLSYDVGIGELTGADVTVSSLKYHLHIFIAS